MIVLSLLAFALSAQTVFYDTHSAFQPAVSANGRSLAFASGGHIWIRPLAGGNPSQLTRGSTDDSEPALSPDGRMVAYRSEADGGGIYLMRASGNGAKRFAADGRRPRFSPDGGRIAYSANGKLFVGDLKKRSSQPVHPAFHSAKDPVWSADGKRLLFAGCKSAAEESCDWWVSAIEGIEPVAVNAAAHFRKSKMDGLPSPEVWQEGSILFTAKVGEDTRVWTVRLDSNGQADGPPRRLTNSRSDERQPAATPDGRILYVSRAQNIDIWSLPLDADNAKPRGPISRITSDPSIDQRPTLSRDGRRIAWETSRGGNFEVWVKDLVTGKEQGLTNGPLREHMPALSPDGSKLVYDAHDGEKVTVYETAFQGGEPVRVREENVGQGSFQWTLGGTVLYFHREPPGTVGLMNLATKQRTVLLKHPRLNLSIADARLSPDGQWIAFPVPFAPHRTRLAVARVTETVIDNESAWTYVVPESFNTAQPEWSPNGKWLYFLSDQTGRLAVWAIAMADGKAAGDAKPILDFPSARLGINELRPRDIGLAVAVDKLALAAAEYNGAIWSTGR